jgi:hypothetical protein
MKHMQSEVEAMRVRRKRTEALYAAIASICAGLGFGLTMAVIWWLYGASLERLVKADPACHLCLDMLRTLKASAFGLVPASCLILIGCGVATLRYLKAQSSTANS